MLQTTLKTVTRVAAVVVLACVVTASIVYWWQYKEIAAMRSDYDAQIADLLYRLSLVPTTTPAVQLPAVVYSRGGLLEATGVGRVEKMVLEQKLIQPYIDYYNEDAVRVIAMYIVVPTAIGEPYQVVAIFGDGNEGVNEFLFGSRERAFDYWEPVCMGPCPFSEKFAEKYPQIVNED